MRTGKLSGNGKYTQKCQQFLKEKYGFGKCLLTTSCTSALEMAAILVNIQPGDEVIMPSFTYVSTANAFVLRGATVVFIDSRNDRPGIDEKVIEGLITEKTKAIVPVHYAGVACDMDKIMDIANRYNLFVIEDAAQAIDSFYTGKDGIKKALGSIGHIGTFSFHDTKNVIAGEGGMLAINDLKFEKRAEIIWEMGTNRSAFFRGEVDKYGWVDLGSSFLPSEITAAFLWAQIENIKVLQTKRLKQWNSYFENLKDWAYTNNIQLPSVPQFSGNNAHIFYLVCNNIDQRSKIINVLKKNNIHAVFHYQSLHKSIFYKSKHDNRELPLADFYSDCLVRLPLFYELEDNNIKFIVEKIKGCLVRHKKFIPKIKCEINNQYLRK